MNQLILFLSRGCGSGLLHPAPGTWGSLAALFIGMAWSYWGGWYSFVVYHCSRTVGYLYLRQREKQLGVHDARRLYLTSGLVCGLPCGMCR